MSIFVTITKSQVRGLWMVAIQRPLPRSHGRPSSPSIRFPGDAWNRCSRLPFLPSLPLCARLGDERINEATQRTHFRRRSQQRSRMDPRSQNPNSPNHGSKETIVAKHFPALLIWRYTEVPTSMQQSLSGTGWILDRRKPSLVLACKRG